MENHLKKVGFYGGTFDPIHFGHLNLAITLFEEHNLDQVFFCPAAVSPEKVIRLPFSTKEHRREMTQLAIEDIEPFFLIDYELEKEGPSYTIETIRSLIQNYTDMQFFLLLGEDTLAGFSKWKEVDQLVELAPPLIGTRPPKESGGTFENMLSDLPSHLQEIIRKGVTPIAPMEISSTALRGRLMQKKYCGHLIPTKIIDYIKRYNLY